MADPSDEMLLTGMQFNNGGIDFGMKAGGPESEAVLLAMTDAMGELLDQHDATNYVEFTIRKRGRLAYTVCVRRFKHPTPHDLRLAAEERADRAEAELARIKAVDPNLFQEEPEDEDEPSPEDAVYEDYGSNGRWLRVALLQAIKDPT